MSTAKFDTLSNVAGTQTVPVATVAQGSAKAWVNFNGTGTVAIRASFNVSSITDNATGNYTANFTNAMANANYTFTGSATDDNASIRIVYESGTYGQHRTASACRFVVVNQSGATGDAQGVYANFFG
jgi:hypothetical protein